MADQNTSLPIRTETNGDVAVKVVDKDTVSQGLAVDAAGNAEAMVHGKDPGSVDRRLRLSEQGHAAVNGIYDAANNTDPSQMGVVAHARAASPADADQIKRVTAISSGSVHAMDISLHDESGNAYSASNPLPVSLEESEGDEKHEYNSASAIAVGASSNHDYTVGAGKSLKLRQILVSASGKMKVEVQVDLDGAGAGAFATKAVAFNSTANPNINIEFAQPMPLPAGAIVRVIRTNKDLMAQDMYSTVVGVEH